MPEQLEALQRFSSLAPNSSARPHKRPLGLPSQSDPSQTSQKIHRAIPSIEESDSEINRPFGAGTKRQRTHESGLNRKFGSCQRSMTREGQGGGLGGLYQSSQTSGTQESIHQVVDSQKSPERKRTFYLSRSFVIVLIYLADSNPYDTPTSLPFISPQDSIPSTDIDPSAIPDSPLGRDTAAGSGGFGGAVQLDRESTKSESPELDSSTQKAPITDPKNGSGKQPIATANRPELSTTSCISKSALQPVPIAQIVDSYMKAHGLGVRQTHEKAAEVDRTPMRGPLTADPAHTRNPQSYRNTLREPDPVFDPIESDTESFHEKQRMQSAKRLRSSKTPTASFKPFRTSGGVEVHRRDGLFLVPSLPHSRTDGSPKSIRELDSSKQCTNIQTPRQDPRVSKISVQSDSKQHRDHDAECIEDPQCRRSVHHGLMDAAQNSSQASTTWSQDSIEIANGTSQSTVQKGNYTSSQNQELDKTTPSSHNDNSVINNFDGGPSVRLQADRPAKEADEQQEKSARAPIDEKLATRKEAPECTTKAKILADKKAAKDHQAQGEELAQAKKVTVKKGELAQAKRKEETSLNEAQVVKKTFNKELARERQNREISLAEEAKKLMLTADGAKKIEAEKIEKKKARLKELVARQMANESKADERAKESQPRNRDQKAREEQRARENAQKLADIDSKDSTDRVPKVYKAQTTRETATAIMEKTQKILADQNLQKLRISDAQNRASANSSTSSDPRSMTPYVPRSSVSKSASHSMSLASTPLSNRSSGNMDAPLRSALRQTPSNLRQSMSSVTFDLPPEDELDNYISSTLKSQSLAAIKNESAIKSSSATNLPENPPRTVSYAPTKTPIPKKATNSKITNIPAKNEKIQTKLNVTRVPKKQKGRAVRSPITPQQASKQEIVISSGSECSTSKEPKRQKKETKWQTGNAEAGPSSRRPVFPAATFAKAKSSAAHIDPQIDSINVENHRPAAPATLPRSTSKMETVSLQMSKSRSPALPLSETISVSSGSASTTSNTDIESDSEGEPQAPSTKKVNGAKDGKVAPITMHEVRKASDMVFNQPEGYSKSKATPQLSSRAASSHSRSTISVHGDGEHFDQAADKQLQLESQRSITSPRTSQASAASNSGIDKRVINQGLDHAGRLPNGNRPAYYKYPPLSELQKLPRATTPKIERKLNTSSSQPPHVSPVGKSESDESSSENDESGSSSDEDEGVDVPPVQTWSEQKLRPYPHMKKVIKCRLC